MKSRSVLIYSALAALVLLCLAAGVRSYSALLNSDQYSYLVYGRSLAAGGFRVEYPLVDILRERIGEQAFFPLGYGRRYYAGGEVISTLEPGFPLLLAAAVRLGGLPAVFGVNVVLLAVFIVAYFCALRGETPAGELAALAAVFTVLSWDGYGLIGYSLVLMRDVPAAAFFWLGFCFLLNGLRKNGRLIPGLVLGAAALAVSGLIRLTNLALIPPVAVYALFAVRKKGWSWKRIAVGTALAVAVFGLVFLPQLIEEASFLGDPLGFARRAVAAFEGFFRPSPGRETHAFSLANFRHNFPRHLSALLALLAPPGMVLAGIGILVCRRRLSTWLVMLPAPLILLVLFSAFGHRARRYRFPLYPFLAYFAVSGAMAVLAGWRELLRSRPAWGRPPAALPLSLAAAAAAVYRALAGPGIDIFTLFLFAFAWGAFPRPFPRRILPATLDFSPPAVFTAAAGLVLLPFLSFLILEGSAFGWRDARRLSREFNACLPAGAVVLGERYLVQNIDTYTAAHGISPGNLAAPLSLELAEAVVVVENSGRRVFAVDNRGYRSMESSIRYLERYFDLAPVCRWHRDELNLANPYYSGEEILTLFRVDARKNREAALSLATPEKKDYLVLLDTGLPPVPEPDTLPSLLRVNGRELPVELFDGLSYVIVPGEIVTIPETVLEISFRRPLPAQPLVGLQALGRSFRVDFGFGRDPDDELFARSGLYLDRRRRRNYRVAGPHSSVALPRLFPSSAEGRVELKVKNILPAPHPVDVEVRAAGRFAGSFTLSADGAWRRTSVPLPDLSPRQGTFDLELFASPRTDDPRTLEELAGSALLAVEWLEIGWEERAVKQAEGGG